MGRNDETQRVISFCKSNGLEKFIEELPQGYQTLLGEDGINLSGGQKQIIAFARVLYKNPQLLILDEATSAMDRNTEKFISNLLNKLKKRISILMISHRISAIRTLADRIYILEDGVIANQGTHLELLETENFYSEYWNELRIKV